MGLFDRHKENSEAKQATEIKQASISDTQLNSINQNNMNSQNIPIQEFKNPFAQEIQQNQTLNPNDPQPNQQTQQQPILEQMPPKFEIEPQEQLNYYEPQTNQAQEQNQQSIQQKTQYENSGLSKDEIQEMIDETVEKLIEEKWGDITLNIDKVIKWKDKTEETINSLKEDITTIGEGFSKLENKLITKISSYDRNILDVNSEIKALEKVFQKITPTLINNVNELEKIADKLREVKTNNNNS